MAVLSPPRVLGAAGQQLSGKLLRLTDAAKWRPSATALGVISGIAQAAAGGMGELTLVNPTTLNVNPFVAVVQGTLTTDQGAYEVPNDALVALTVTGQHASQYRRSLILIEVNDSQASGVASSGTTDRARLYILDGTLSATSPGALPTLPANSLALGEIAIPPTGQSVTLTPYFVRTSLRGARLSVPTEATANALSSSLMTPGAQFYAEDTGANGFWDATLGRILWFDTRWQTWTPQIAINAIQSYMTLGNATVNCAYFRSGRKVDIRGIVVIGSTTNFNGLSGVYYMVPPPGLAPKGIYAQYANVGTFQMQGNANNPHGFCAVNTDPGSAANLRRIIFYSATNLGALSNSGATFSAITAGHFFQFQATYETAFEA